MIDYPIVAKSRRALKSFVPAKVIQSRLHRRVFTQFAEKIGLVYFGYVDQRSDEHSLIRGLTVSASHRDNHYCIGSFGGYDITLVERVDAIHFPGKPTKHHDWVIMTFDLHASTDIPHIFVGLHTHSETFYAQLFTKFSQLVKAPLNITGIHSAAFMHRYAVYTEPAYTVAVEALLTPEVTTAIADTFGSLTFEISEGTLFIYAEHQHPSVNLLEKMLKHGLWLARIIDSRPL